MHRAAVWQHSSNSNIKIVHNSIEHFLWNPSDFFSDDVLSCLLIVFTNPFFQVPPQKIVRRVEILGIGWPGVIDLTQNESVPWEVMPEVFKCFVREMSGHKWSTTHRVLKSHRGKMSVIYMQSWKQCALPVITTMALWQLMHLGTWCMYIYIYVYIYI